MIFLCFVLNNEYEIEKNINQNSNIKYFNKIIKFNI